MAQIRPQPLLLQANMRTCPYTLYTPALVKCRDAAPHPIHTPKHAKSPCYGTPRVPPCCPLSLSLPSSGWWPVNSD